MSQLSGLQQQHEETLQQLQRLEAENAQLEGQRSQEEGEKAQLSGLQQQHEDTLQQLQQLETEKAQLEDQMSQVDSEKAQLAARAEELELMASDRDRWALLSTKFDFFKYDSATLKRIVDCATSMENMPIEVTAAIW